MLGLHATLTTRNITLAIIGIGLATAAATVVGKCPAGSVTQCCKVRGRLREAEMRKGMEDAWKGVLGTALGQKTEPPLCVCVYYLLYNRGLLGRTRYPLAGLRRHLSSQQQQKLLQEKHLSALHSIVQWRQEQHSNRGSFSPRIRAGGKGQGVAPAGMGGIGMGKETGEWEGLFWQEQGRVEPWGKCSNSQPRASLPALTLAQLLSSGGLVTA